MPAALTSACGLLVSTATKMLPWKAWGTPFARSAFESAVAASRSRCVSGIAGKKGKLVCSF